MRIKKSDDEILEGDSTPMIDMVFQLIAFFMVLINFTEVDQDNRVKLPTSELAKPPDAPLEDTLTINIGRSGDSGPWGVFMGGQTVGTEEELDPLVDQLNREREFLVKQSKAPKDVVIIIRAHEKAPTGLIQHVIRKSQDAQFEQFALRAEEKLRY